MSKIMVGSGKFVAPVSEYSAQGTSPIIDAKPVALDVTVKEEGSQAIEIPPMPINPDVRPKFIRFAEEYFGRYWLVTFIVIIMLLFRKK